MWSTASESIRNGWYNLDRLNRSSRLAQPGITAVDRLWFKRRSSHEPNQIHKLIWCIFNVFWRPEYAQKNKLYVSASKWRVRSSEQIEPISLCFAGFACKLAVSLANGIKINVHSITLLCLCLDYVWTLHLWINQNIEVVFHRTQRGWKLKLCVEIKFMWSTALETSNLSVVILLACCFNTMFTGVEHVSARADRFYLLLNPVHLELRSASESIQPA